MEESPKKILIADDDLNYSDYAKSALTKAGFFVDTAGDGDETLEKTNNKSYDMILLDILMPAKTGLEVLEELRGKNDKTPAIVFTTLLNDEERRQALSLGAVGYYVKSTDFNELVSIVSSYFSGQIKQTNV